MGSLQCTKVEMVDAYYISNIPILKKGTVAVKKGEKPYECRICEKMFEEIFCCNSWLEALIYKWMLLLLPT